MDFQSNLVLITGALGWLGVNLINSLVKGLPDCPSLSQPQANLRIRCLILPSQDPLLLTQLSDQIEVIQGDLRSLEDCEHFCQDSEGATLFHTAGMIHPQGVKEFYDINVHGTVNLLEAAIAAKVRRAVIVSSNSPCGCNPHIDHLFDEVSPYNPYMNYGRSKMLMELEVKKRQQADQIETVIIRAPWFYGPNQPPRQTLFFQMIRDGKAPIVGSGNNRRSMVYLDNLCQGLILASQTEKANGEIYWIADEKPYTMNEVIDTIENLLESEFGQKCTHKRLKLPNFVSEIALMIDAFIQKFGFYHQKIHVLSEMNKTIVCSVAKAKFELGYTPSITLEEGMRRSLQCIFNEKIHYNS
jgi:nucleoside-diphosphate-sugar epimerase